MSEDQNGLDLDVERVLAAQLAMLETLQGKLRADIDGTPEHFAGHAREAASMARAIAEVSSEIRQLERVGARHAATMTTAEKLELLLDAFPLISADEQKAILAQLRRIAKKT